MSRTCHGRVLGGQSIAEQRLVLLVAWYAQPTRGAARRSRLSAQSSVPRVTRSQTWPALLQPPPRPPATATEPVDAPPTPFTVAPVSPVWEALLSPRGGAAALTPPAALRQHFFLHSPDDVRQRLAEEHGVDGSWTTAAKKRRRE